MKSAFRCASEGGVAILCLECAFGARRARPSGSLRPAGADVYVQCGKQPGQLAGRGEARAVVRLGASAQKIQALAWAEFLSRLLRSDHHSRSRARARTKSSQARQDWTGRGRASPAQHSVNGKMAQESIYTGKRADVGACVQRMPRMAACLPIHLPRHLPYLPPTVPVRLYRPYRRPTYQRVDVVFPPVC